MTALDRRPSIERSADDSRPALAGSRGRSPIALAILLVAHGVVHFFGVVAAFESLESSRPLEYLSGTWVVSNDLMVGLIGTMWAAVGLGFAVAAIVVLTEFRSWERPVIVLGVISFAMCVLALWSAWFGLVVNAVIIVVAIVGSSDRQTSSGPTRLSN